MGEYRFSVHVAAPPEQVYDLWVNLDRAHEWIRGLTKITDRVGDAGTTGATYVTRFGPVRSPTTVLSAERPRHIVTKFGNWYLRGENEAKFTPEGDGTRLEQTFRTVGIIPAITARLFATGSYEGSFKSELEHFARLAEADAKSARAKRDEARRVEAKSGPSPTPQA